MLRGQAAAQGRAVDGGPARRHSVLPEGRAARARRDLAEISQFADKVKTTMPEIRQCRDAVDFALLLEMVDGGDEPGTVEEAEEDFFIEED